MLSTAAQAAPAACQKGSRAWMLWGGAQAALARGQSSRALQVLRAVRQANGLWGQRRCRQPAPHTAQVLGEAAAPADRPRVMGQVQGVSREAAAPAEGLPAVGQAGKLWQEGQGPPAQMQARDRRVAGRGQGLWQQWRLATEVRGRRPGALDHIHLGYLLCRLSPVHLYPSALIVLCKEQLGMQRCSRSPALPLHAALSDTSTFSARCHRLLAA